jgi:hypothetical protein
VPGSTPVPPEKRLGVTELGPLPSLDEPPAVVPPVVLLVAPLVVPLVVRADLAAAMSAAATPKTTPTPRMLPIARTAVACLVLRLPTSLAFISRTTFRVPAHDGALV